LRVPAAGDFVSSFHGAHERRYGYADPARPTEVVTVRARLVGMTPKLELSRQAIGAPHARAAVKGVRRSIFAGSARATPEYDRAWMRAGHRFAGPAIVTEYSATTLVPAGWQARVDAYGNLVLEPKR
jgi:N-methylhydantoinase A